MSALGQKRIFTHLWPMSALPPKVDIELARITFDVAWSLIPKSFCETSLTH